MKRSFQLFLILIFIFIVFARVCYCGQDIGIETIISQIEHRYENISDVNLRIIEQNRSQDSQVDVMGMMKFKAPDKIKTAFEIISNHGKYRMKNLLVYNGDVLWQEQVNSNTQKINIFKSSLENNSVQAQEIISKYNPKQQFANFMQNYNVIDVRLLDVYGRVCVLDMEIKPRAKDRMIQMLKAKGQKQAKLMIPEKAFFYWDRNKEFVVKIETQSKNQAFKTLIEYSDISINSGIEDEAFNYVPAKNARVIDLSRIIGKEAGRREFEGADNKLVGRSFPDFDLKGVFNDQYLYDQLKGKTLIVSFWEHWSSPCQKELALIEELYQDIYTENYVQLITVTTNKEKALEIVGENGYSFPVLIDVKANLAEQSGVDSIPKIFIIDQQGKIAAVYNGYHSDICEIIKNDIKRLNPEE